jgi:phosphatidylglycerophosphate synthase
MKKTPFFAGYTASLKNPFAEELVDLAVFRPLGYIFVKLFLPFPVTPNQISLMAMAAGLAAGLVLAQGTPHAFIIGGLLYCLSNILDCCDGMLARIKKNGTLTGRIVDGVVDYVTGGAVFIGLGTGLTAAVRSGTLHLPANAWLLVAAAALSTVFHAICSDYFRNTYLSQQTSPSPGNKGEIEKFTAELARLNTGRGRTADKILIRLYLGYCKLQAGNVRCHGNQAPSPEKQPPKAVRPMTVIFWNLIGPSTHVSFFILAALLFRPMVFFIFVVAAANAWMVFLLLLRIFETTLPGQQRKI